MSAPTEQTLLLDVDRVLQELTAQHADLVARLRGTREWLQAQAAPQQPGDPLGAISGPNSSFAPAVAPAVGIPGPTAPPPSAFVPPVFQAQPAAFVPPFVTEPAAPVAPPSFAPFEIQAQPEAIVAPTDFVPPSPAAPAPAPFIPPAPFAPPAPAQPEAYLPPPPGAPPVPSEIPAQPEMFVPPAAAPLDVPVDTTAAAVAAAPAAPSVYNPAARKTKRDYNYFTELDAKLAALAAQNGNGTASANGTSPHDEPGTTQDWSAN